MYRHDNVIRGKFVAGGAEIVGGSIAAWLGGG